jgi:hypothetical protein
MKQPESQLLNAAARLGGNQDFQRFLAWIEASREDARNTAESVCSADAYRAACSLSYAAALGDILRFMAEAQEVTRKSGVIA